MRARIPVALLWALVATPTLAASPVAPCASEAVCDLAGGKAARDGGVLILKTANGVEAKFHDDNADCAPGGGDVCHAYKLVGKLASQKLWVVKDTAETKFVSAATGETPFSTSAEPIFSPDRKWLVALQSEKDLGIYALRIYQLAPGQVLESFNYSSDAAEPKETHGEFASWKSPSSFLLHVHVDGDAEVRDNVVTRDKNGWTIKRPWKK